MPAPLAIPTEPIGSIPRPPGLIQAIKDFGQDGVSREELDGFYDEALRDTISRFEQTGSPVITDGEQTKPSFATYPIDGAPNLAPDGVSIPFVDGHVRQLPRLTQGPFRYQTHAQAYLTQALKYAQAPIKQAVISASALSLLYPSSGLADYPRRQFIEDLVNEALADVRGCLDAGAYNVQIDFTEARLSLKLDPSKKLLSQFLELNNRVLAPLSPEERERIGVHTCPGGDWDSTHSADVDYAELLPSLFTLEATNFYIQLASEKEPRRVLEVIKQHMRKNQRIFVGVIDVLDPVVETPLQVRDRLLLAAEYIEPQSLGSTDDCGFSPFADDTSTARDTAFAKIQSRVEGTLLAAQALGL